MQNKPNVELRHESCSLQNIFQKEMNEAPPSAAESGTGYSGDGESTTTRKTGGLPLSADVGRTRAKARQCFFRRSCNPAAAGFVWQE